MNALGNMLETADLSKATLDVEVRLRRGRVRCREHIIKPPGRSTLMRADGEGDGEGERRAKAWAWAWTLTGVSQGEGEGEDDCAP